MSWRCRSLECDKRKRLCQKRVIAAVSARFRAACEAESRDIRLSAASPGWDIKEKDVTAVLIA